MTVGSWYVGCKIKDNEMEVFQMTEELNHDEMHKKYQFLSGPFENKAAAEFYAFHKEGLNG